MITKCADLGQETHKITQTNHAPKAANKRNHNVRVCVILLGCDRDKKLQDLDHHVANPQE